MDDYFSPNKKTSDGRRFWEHILRRLVASLTEWGMLIPAGVYISDQNASTCDVE